MNAIDLKLPKSNEDKIKLYILTNNKINEIWKEYVLYTNLKYIPATTKIFAIIFCEMDFYESILARIRVHLSESDITELKKHDVIWDW